MEFDLTIDRGNTAIKGALWRPDGTMAVAAKGDESLPAGDLAAMLLQQVGAAVIATAIYCSVVMSDRAEDLDSLKPVCRCLIDLDYRTPLPIDLSGYKTPATLGADRIAAACGAIAVAGADRPLLVSDMGTAITYDTIDLDSAGRATQYLGGNIAPGIDMRLRALAAFTDALPAVSAEGGDIPMVGYTTATAIRSGAVRGVVAELEYYHRAAGKDALAVLTGGSADFLVKNELINFDYIYEPFLVHKGLYSIIKQLKNKELYSIIDK